MKTILDRDQFAAALARCALVTDKKSPTPASGKVRLLASTEVLSKRVDYYSTALSLDVRGTLEPVELTGECDVLVDTVGLLRAVNAMPVGGVTLTLREDVLTVSSGKRKFDIATMPGTDAPAVTVPGGDVREWRGSVLAALIKRVQHAMDDNESPMNGVLIRHSGNVTEALATNTRIFATMTAETVEAPELVAQIPASALPVVLDTLHTDETVGVSVTPGRIFFRRGVVTVSAARRETEKLAETNFKQWINGVESGPTVTLDAPTLRDAAGVIGAGVVQLRLAAGAGVLALRGRTGKNTAEDELPADVDGEAAVARVDPKFVVPALRDIAGPVALRIGDQIVSMRSGVYLCAMGCMRSDENDI